MPKIWLNERGKKIHPHLANEWLAVYGFNPDSYSFIIWDEIMSQWVYIPTNQCEGQGNAVE